VPHVEADAGTPVKFVSIDDSPVQGIAFDAANSVVYFGTQHGIYSLPYVEGAADAGTPTKISSVRTGGIPSGSDGDVHSSSSVAVSGSHLYASVGSSCNACTEIDSTRAVILQMDLNGANRTTKATRIRNAIALATNPGTGTVWAGGAGQDNLATGHPYEYFDALTVHAGTADYGWPACEENHHAYVSGSDCSNTVQPLIEFPAYSTLIGAAFYPANQTGAHAFPQEWRGLYVASHGSWHTTSNGQPYTLPRVSFVALNGDAPATAVNWQDPAAQWTTFIDGFQKPNGTRRARATGLAVGTQGSLFFADDFNSLIYRIRPR
jgi:glucose/arabinose dehydrogenase